MSRFVPTAAALTLAGLALASPSQAQENLNDKCLEVEEECLTRKTYEGDVVHINEYTINAVLAGGGETSWSRLAIPKRIARNGVIANSLDFEDDDKQPLTNRLDGEEITGYLIRTTSDEERLHIEGVNLEQKGPREWFISTEDILNYYPRIQGDKTSLELIGRMYRIDCAPKGGVPVRIDFDPVLSDSTEQEIPEQSNAERDINIYVNLSRGEESPVSDRASRKRDEHKERPRSNWPKNYPNTNWITITGVLETETGRTDQRTAPIPHGSIVSQDWKEEAYGLDIQLYRETIREVITARINGINSTIENTTTGQTFEGQSANLGLGYMRRFAKRPENVSDSINAYGLEIGARGELSFLTTGEMQGGGDVNTQSLYGRLGGFSTLGENIVISGEAFIGAQRTESEPKDIGIANFDELKDSVVEQIYGVGTRIYFQKSKDTEALLRGKLEVRENQWALGAEAQARWKILNIGAGATLHHRESNQGFQAYDGTRFHVRAGIGF